MDGLAFLKQVHADSGRYLPLVDRAELIFPKRAPGNGEYNVGWNCGLIGHDRPWFAEYWATDSITMLTVFVPALGLEDAAPEAVDGLCERYGVYRKVSSGRRATVMPFTDGRGNAFWSVNLIVGDDVRELVDDTAKVYPFSALNAYNRGRGVAPAP